MVPYHTWCCAVGTVPWQQARDGLRDYRQSAPWCHPWGASGCGGGRPDKEQFLEKVFVPVPVNESAWVRYQQVRVPTGTGTVLVPYCTYINNFPPSVSRFLTNLFKPGIKLLHIEPPGFVPSVGGSRGTTLTPAREECPVGTFVDCHRRQHIAISTEKR